MPSSAAKLKTLFANEEVASEAAVALMRQQIVDAVRCTPYDAATLPARFQQLFAEKDAHTFRKHACWPWDGGSVLAPLGGWQAVWLLQCCSATSLYCVPWEMSGHIDLTCSMFMISFTAVSFHILHILHLQYVYAISVPCPTLFAQYQL